ncbi:hypothetical protein [Streptomyces sp. NPDC026589]|uniref:hypothetical protein n=1 Tax=Streptomyces sp. NPDC026589 TaxID=3155609 RepID=UPI0033C572D2
MGDIERPRRLVRPATATGAVRPAVGAGRASARPGPTAGLLGARPPFLLEALRRMDARLADEELRDTAAWLREQYTASYGTAPVGYVAQCFLGPPYVDHLLGTDGRILEHYAPADPMPDPFSAARMLARSGAYAFIEVYEGGLILPVLADGGVVRP